MKGIIDRYDYKQAVKADVFEALENDAIWDEIESVAILTGDDLAETLSTWLWADDSVTGNASGSYTFSRFTAEQYVGENLDLLAEAAEAFGLDAQEIGERILSGDYEGLDVTIRCYLLDGCIREVLDEMGYTA